jgi:hypothetical protein
MARKCFPEIPANFLTVNPSHHPPRKSNSSLLALAGWSSIPPHNGPSNILGKLKKPKFIKSEFAMLIDMQKYIYFPSSFLFRIL